jgi:F0F1-type ATP synthase membrane subunit c/vacuolar-type H+-ATPase subunit K
MAIGIVGDAGVRANAQQPKAGQCMLTPKSTSLHE